ncbi:MAG: sugar phosphate isomerase/epimerase [Gemmataceae bacterium]|nr:sugar phosphate isomerase/epimerase [Gemmataceae bacterium]
MKKLSIGSWAFLFNQDQPATDFHGLVHDIANLGYEGVELGGFAPHPNPHSHDTKEKRQHLAAMVRDHGLEFSALAADLWSQKLVSVDDHRPWLAAAEKNLAFAQDLGITTMRIDTAEPVAAIRGLNLDPRLMMDRAVQAFAACAKRAADCGITICWEFEPGFPLNKPSEILEVVQRVRDAGGVPNFGVLFDTCHAHMCAAVGANQTGEREMLPGGALELLQRLQGKINHVHFIDSDGSLNEHHTSTRIPLGAGVLRFDQLMPALLASGVPNDWWCVDLCFWPNAWEAAGECRRFLDRLRRKYAA